MGTSKRYSPEIREQAVRLAREAQREHSPQCAAIVSISAKIDCTHEELRQGNRQTETGRGERGGLASDKKTHLKQLQRGNRELKQANGILHKVSDFFSYGSRPRTEVMVSFIDAHRARRDAELEVEIRRVYEEIFRVYGAEKPWRHPNREDRKPARCTVERQMARLCLYGTVHSGKKYRTTMPETAIARRTDRPTQFGRPISPTSRRGQDWSLWLSSLMFSPSHRWLAGITPKQKLSLAALPLLLTTVKVGGLPHYLPYNSWSYGIEARVS